ncbi:hypothetical protein FACS1894111_05730 [Clostridia bacterium]|nr:hypothetical protein FACS1894111_05730 [Clostridia bacterium]
MTNKKSVSDSDTKEVKAERVADSENTGTDKKEILAEQPTKKAQYDEITNFVYVGPSLPGGRLKSLATLGGTYEEIKDYYKEAVALFPKVERLIVPVSQLAEARAKTQTSGNILHNYYRDVISAIQTKGEEQ